MPVWCRWARNCAAGLALSLLAGFAACGGEPAQEPAASAPAAPAAAATPAVQTMAAILPPAGQPPGWTRAKEPQVFGSENLWEFIDGAAETYLGFGFQEALTAGYSYEATAVTIDVYRMADALHAYGIYMQELAPAAEFLAVGREGYVNSNVLNFWKGSSYVKITAAAADRPGQAQLAALARAVAERIPDTGSEPREIAWFPAERLAPHSIKYIPKDVLGQSFFANGFEAQYQDGKSAVKLTAVVLDTPDAAEDALQRYRAFVATSGKVRAALKAPGDGGFSGDDRFYGRICAIRSGSMIILALGAPTDAGASTLVAEFIARAAGSPKR